jgi:hypothetical protein
MATIAQRATRRHPPVRALKATIVLEVLRVLIPLTANLGESVHAVVFAPLVAASPSNVLLGSILIYQAKAPVYLALLVTIARKVPAASAPPFVPRDFIVPMEPRRETKIRVRQESLAMKRAANLSQIVSIVPRDLPARLQEQVA